MSLPDDQAIWNLAGELKLRSCERSDPLLLLQDLQ